MDYQDFQLQDFEFRDERFWSRVHERVQRLIIGPDKLGRSPVRFRDRAKGIPSIDVLCAALHLDESSLTEIIAVHKKRMFLRLMSVLLLYMIILFLFFILARFGLFPILSSLRGTKFFLTYRTGSSILFLLFLYLVAFVFARSSMRLAFAATATRFADTVCVRTIVYVIVELSRHDVLTDPHKRRRLMSRIDSLAKGTLLLAARFSSRAESNQKSLREHFKRIERYVRERERWVAMPRATTLNDLRRDFYRLGEIYLSGNYGEFIWPDAIPLEEPHDATVSGRIRNGLPRFLGIVVPLGLMAYFLWKPIPGVDSKVVSLIFLAWLLLGIDAILKLGIVAGVVNLAKEIKTLK
jgi:hypothetical protein